MIKLCEIETIDLLIDKIQHIESLTIETIDGKTYADFDVTDVELPKKDCTINLLSALQDIKKGMYISTIVDFSCKYDYKENFSIGNITYKKVNKTDELKQKLDEVAEFLTENSIAIELWRKSEASSDAAGKRKGNPMKKLTVSDIIDVLKKGLDECQ